jgi:hypothetical protein
VPADQPLAFLLFIEAFHHSNNICSAAATLDMSASHLNAQRHGSASYPRPARGRDPDLRPGLRSFPVGSYLIIYRVEGEDVLILHVVRGSRDLEALFRR